MMGVVRTYFDGFFWMLKGCIGIIRNMGDLWDDFYRDTLVRDRYIEKIEPIAHKLGILTFIILSIVMIGLFVCFSC